MFAARSMTDFWDHIPTAFANEADVELRLVEPLLQALGFEISDIAKGHPVIFQQGRAGRPNEADYVVFDGPLRTKDTSLIVVEVKGPAEALSGGKAQGESYAFNLRAPLLLLINGVRLEIWQLQPTQESTCVLDIAVAELISRRGEIERMLSKQATIEYCQQLTLKDIKFIVDDFSAYENAELRRTLEYESSIDRTLRLAGNSDPKGITKASLLLDQFHAGATILAPSGYGKTTLCYSTFRRAIERRWKLNTKILAFDIPLTDLAESGLSLLSFSYHRLEAHCPANTEAALRTLFRSEGAILLCDGFDRLTSANRLRIETEIRTLLRDYPKVALYVFSREASKPDLALPLLVLEKLSPQEQRDMEQLVLANGGLPYVIGMLPNALKMLCANPLLLELTLDYWKKEHRFPEKLDGLFRSWLDSLLGTNSRDAISKIALEEALAILAEATIETPISGAHARKLLAASSISESTLNDLVQCDAVRISGSTIELQHEALADYLRAKAVASLNEASLLDRLVTIPVRADSLFPSLLMALMPSHRSQSALWTRLSSLNIPAYLDALRYRSDVSEELKSLDETALAETYLNDYLAGITLPLNSFFPQLREAVIQELLDEPNAEIAVTGKVFADPPEILYNFHPQSGHNPVTVGMPDENFGFRGVNLHLSGYRLDSGRLLGASTLRDALFDVVNQHELRGGTEWANERLAGRLRFLVDEYQFPANDQSSLDEIETTLSPHVDKIVRSGLFSSAIKFSVRSLLDDIILLRANGQSVVDRWWLRLGWQREYNHIDDTALASLLDEYYRRQQHVYAELIEHSFASLSNEMGFYLSLPVRWQIRVARRGPSPAETTLFFRWFPVASWDEAGADVEFGNETPPPVDFAAIQEALARFGRLRAKNHIWSGWTRLPSFDGRQWTGRFDGATPVTHDVCRIITDELETLFSDLPHNDGLEVNR